MVFVCARLVNGSMQQAKAKSLTAMSDLQPLLAASAPVFDFCPGPATTIILTSIAMAPSRASKTREG
ncbi:MAG: hypothetical protein AB7O43_13925 [Hyphomicrobiaceae bacterium]